MGKLAAMLVNRFGSLERAFYNFDYNRKGKITRGQWQTVFATVRIDVQEVTGIPQKKVFRMIAAFGESTSMLEISFDQWRLFFENELAGGATLPRFRLGVNRLGNCRVHFTRVNSH
ncbi:SEC1A [Symbiodinium microadriaticum]|nr:SEC1A [Symbiodinium microadriaticum]